MGQFVIIYIQYYCANTRQGTSIVEFLKHPKLQSSSLSYQPIITFSTFFVRFLLPACRIKGKAKDAVETKSKEVRA